MGEGTVVEGVCAQPWGEGSSVNKWTTYGLRKTELVLTESKTPDESFGR